MIETALDTNDQTRQDCGRVQQQQHQQWSTIIIIIIISTHYTASSSPATDQGMAWHGTGCAIPGMHICMYDTYVDTACELRVDWRANFSGLQQKKESAPPLCDPPRLVRLSFCAER